VPSARTVNVPIASPSRVRVRVPGRNPPPLTRTGSPGQNNPVGTCTDGADAGTAADLGPETAGLTGGLAVASTGAALALSAPRERTAAATMVALVVVGRVLLIAGRSLHVKLRV